MISNMNIKFSTSCSNINGENVCAITHEEFVSGRLIVQLGVRNPEWTQTIVLTWSALMQYIFSSANGADEFTHRYNWNILCPIRKSLIDVTEIRPIGVVIKDTMAKMRSGALVC